MDDSINNYFDARREGILELLSKLIAVETVNPPGNEHLAAAIMRETLEPLGIECITYEKEPNRTNMIARVGSGSPSTLIACHFDVVPPGGGWDTPPYQAVVRDGRVYGRGSTDNKGQLAVMLEVAKFLKRNEDKLLGEVILVGAADEERGSGLGLEWLADEGLLDADFAIIPDIGHQMRSISIAEKGALFLKITCHGKQAHGSRPETGVNAAWCMIDLLNHIRAMNLGGEAGALFSPATRNLGIICGGTAPNIVPAQCTAEVDFRFLPSQKAEEIEKSITDKAKEIEQANKGARFTMERVMKVDPFQIDTDNDLLKRLVTKATAVLGQEPEFVAMSGSTVAKPLVRTGTIAVGFGPGENEQAHATNESIAIDELVDFAKILAGFLVKEVA